MDGKLTWNGKKKELWGYGHRELTKLLQELENERRDLEVKYRMQGRTHKRFNSNAVRSYYNKNKSALHIGNLGQVRKRIACIKTILNIKFSEAPR